MHDRLSHGFPNGLLHVSTATPPSCYWRYLPSDDLRPFVEHYWTIEWNLSAPERRETLPYPSAHIVLEPDVCALAGVTTKKYSRLLEGQSRVLGVKFRPGGLRPFVELPVSAFTDRTVPLHEAMSVAGSGLNKRALGYFDHQTSIAIVEDFLCGFAPRPSATLIHACALADRIAGDRNLKTVEQLAKESGLGVRTLQRLFDEYIGVGPKWMIRRYRLQEAATRLAANSTVDWAQIALDLGYADQAHFIRDFKSIIGKSPADYFRGIGGELKV